MIRKQKQDLINKDNDHENYNQIKLMCEQRGKVLLKNALKTKFNQDVYLGAYVIIAVRNNGTVGDLKGKVIDTFNIRNQAPYKE